MNLAQTQRAMFDVLKTPLLPSDAMRGRTADGRSISKIAREIVKPNRSLTSFERLEIYNRQYWFRIVGSLMEDFSGLRSLVGDRRFQQLATEYLQACPSRSFTLRNLGSRLPQWLRKNPKHIKGVEWLALDMARLEWAEIEAFDGTDLPVLQPRDLARVGSDPTLKLQPYIQLLELDHEVDDLLLTIRRKEEQNSFSSNSVVRQMRRSRIKRSRSPEERRIYLVVHRHEFSVYFKRVDREAFALLRQLRAGRTLGEAIDRVNWRGTPPQELAANIQEWFTNWASLGWFAKDAPAAPRKRLRKNG